MDGDTVQAVVRIRGDTAEVTLTQREYDADMLRELAKTLAEVAERMNPADPPSP